MSFSPIRAVVAVATVVALAVPATAVASPTMLTGIADENVLTEHLQPGARDIGMENVVKQWKAAGVQDVRTFAQWDKIAPKPTSIRAPEGFDAKSSASYDFVALDRKIDLILANGMTPTLVVSGPAPVWGSTEPARRDGRISPDSKAFGEFASAVATHVADRVERYIVWNEPNVATWLQPQNRCTASRNCTPNSAHLYRDLARAGYQAIHAADPSSRVAVGGTSSLGAKFVSGQNTTTQPLTFLRNMACVDSKYRPVTTGACKNFRPVTGDALSYHPHSKELSPGEKDPDPNNARMADLSRLTKVLDKLTAKGRLKVNGAKKMPLWLDEYAYETNPPDKGKDMVSTATAAAYSQWGWSVAARNPRVQLLAQYEWFDEPIGDDGGFTRWQSGLFFENGKAKPLAKLFPHPIFGWRTSKTAQVWGQARPGNAKTKVVLQRKSGKSYRAYKTVTTNANGIFQVKVPKSTKARYRFTYTDPATGKTVTSGTTNLRKVV